MAIPLSADALIKALRAEGVTVVEHNGWRTHNRNHKGPWGPVNGIVIHHTVTRGTDNTVRICRDGHTNLPGPLCHGVIAKDGTVHLIGHGRANHAGSGDADVLHAVQRESYATTPPRPNQNDTDGNARFYGFECENLGDGQDPWPAAQIEAIERVAAAICRRHGWTAKSVIGHKEWTNAKIDPRGVSITTIRARIAERLKHKPSAGSGTHPQTLPVGSPVSLARLRTAAREDPSAPQSQTSYRSGVLTVEKALHAEGLLAEKWIDGSYGTKTLAAYAAWQRRLGYSGADADGIPGRKSLTALGTRHAFPVYS
ncbi:N-acetylmuramoyl-L-alanine amidase [Streptomyces indicus]|uniref:N-acetylmuramoyl-L-alanine amidase n=1 Tax=Streptomyces indicus TaxID=417292 RepID=A0A1G8W7R2_9ACTN|nr:N-acetylmuramoyl-L-alanine amidase [Streptomyces indicus]SDJ74332.1 N-acetylmuramoyl-L-alanine amidase [Streptomyces indicus]